MAGIDRSARRTWTDRAAGDAEGGLAMMIGRVAAVLGVCLVLFGERAAGQVPGELRGHVLDARTSQPIVQARVDVVGRTDGAQTTADGAFVLRGLEPRAYTVRVRALGYVAKQFDVEIANGHATTLEVVLDAAAATLGPIVIGALRDTQALNATTFDRQAIEASHRRDVGELLQNTPGIVVTQSGGAGAATHLSIRGSSSNEVLIVIDGAPVNSAINGDFDLSTIPLEMVERLTVLTGAQSARYGSRALAGVIEIETRRPTHEASAEVRGGAFGEQNASFALGEARALGESRTRLGGSLAADVRSVRGDFPYEVPAVRGGGTARRVNSNVDSRNVLGTTTLDGEAWSATARGSWQSLERGLAGSIVQPSATGRERQERASGGFDLRGRRSAVTWAVTGDATHEHATYADTAPPFGTRYSDTANATSLTSSASITAEKHGIAGTLGGEARSLDVRTTMLAAGSPHWQRMYGAWANLRGARDFGEDWRADLEIGARLDENSLITGPMGSPRVSGSLTRGAIVASASYAEGFAPPTLADQFFHEGVLVRPNPDLKPERTRNDIEGRLALRETALGPVSLNAQAAVYRADVDGMILWFPDFRFIWSPSNFDVHRAGWELSGRATVLADLLDVQGALDRSDVTYTGPVASGQVTYRPRTTGNVTLGTTRRALRVEVANQYVGERRTVPGSELNVLDPYWRTDVRVTATMTRPGWSLDATLGVENVFDRPAEMLVDYPFPSRDWTVAVRMRRGSGRPDSR
jgi:outer membrane cobalamin receptor